MGTRWASLERSSFEEVQPIPQSSGGIVWHHAGNHYHHPRHRHAALELNLVVRGRGHYEVGGRCHPLSEGTALFIAPATDHHLEERTPDFEMWILALGPALLERTCDEAGSAAFLRALSAGDCRRILSIDDTRWLTREIRRFAEARSTTFLRAGLAYALTGAQEAFARAGGDGSDAPISDAVRRCMTLLEDDPTLSRAELADHAGADPDALGQAFKRELGLGLVLYRNRLRIRRFLELASSGQPTLLAACLEAGFGSYPQFHRVFVAETGQTPRDYLTALRARSGNGAGRSCVARSERGRGNGARIRAPASR